MKFSVVKNIQIDQKIDLNTLITIILLTQKSYLVQKSFYKLMIILNDNYQNIAENIPLFQLRGFSISEINIEGYIEIIFQKGIGISLTTKIIDLYRDSFVRKRQGYIKDTIGNLTVYIHFFDKEKDNKLIFMYIDKTENLMNYTELYHLSKKIYNR